MATKNLVPRADGEGKIGTSTKRWGEGHFDDLEVADDLTITDDASVGGDLTVTGAETVGGDLTVAGGLILTGAFQDTDGDTKVQVEESADEDIIRFDCGVGGEQITIQDGKVEPTTNNDVDLGSSSKKFKNLLLSGTATALGIQDADGDTKIQVEESVDEDIIRFDCGAGGEQITIQDGKIEPATDNDMDLGSSSKGFKDLFIAGVATVPNTGLHLLDTDASHDLIIRPGSDLTADKTLTLTTGNADRTVTLSGNLTVEADSVVNQDLSTDASPTFHDLLLTGDITIPNTGLHLLDTNASHDLIIKPGSNLTADKTLTITTGDTNRTLTLGADSSISGTAIVESLLTTQGDIITRGASIAERLVAVATGQVLKSAGVGAKPAWSKPSLSDSEFGMGSGTRSTAGVVNITGLGFSPVLIVMLTRDNVGTNLNWSAGWDNQTTRMCVYQYDNDTHVGDKSDAIGCIRRTSANEISCYVSALGGDGFSLTFALTGTAAMRYLYLAFG